MLIVFQWGRCCSAVREGVGDQPHRRPWWIDVRPPGRVLLEDVVLDRSPERGGGDALARGGQLVEEQQHRRRRVDRHRRGHPVLGDPAHEQLHVVERVDGDTHLAHLAVRHRVVAVVPHLRRQVEGDRQPALPGTQQVVEALVGLFRAAESGVLPHRPEPRAVPVGPDPPCEGELAGRRPVLLMLSVEALERQPRFRLCAKVGSARTVAHPCCPACAPSG